MIRVCRAAGCESCGAAAVQEALEATGRPVKTVGCLGLCSAGPLVASDEALFGRVQGADLSSAEPIPLDLPFFRRQVRVVLERCGVVDPTDLADALQQGSYGALQAALSRRPEDVIEEIVRSGLRGRGGAGYPTGLKWATVRKAPGDRKFVVCNADEGDPGAFMDRSVLESDPHRVLEGMAIAAHAVGADHGYVYVRAEYPLAIERLRRALHQAEREKLLNLRIELRMGAGAFVCGEETALLASMEGRRGNPRPRPPYPATEGLFGKPTLINNVETFANIPAILAKGADWFASLGTARSKGTKVFALAGAVRNTGLVEVPMGMPLREIVEDLGGGCPAGRVKAVQTGGPSGGCIPREHLDTPVDYESLAALGSIMGSGGLIVMDESTRMVEVARYFMDFCRSESCGKCLPCRAGTVQMHRILDRFCRGAGRPGDVEQLEQLCDLLRQTSLCGLGTSAPNPVLSTLRFFREEYEPCPS